jgi:2-dehydro-3-deoxygluconokinase
VTPVALALGESMALFDALEPGVPRYGSSFQLRVAGAESNFAIGLQRLGVPTRLISRVGADVLGDLVIDAVAGEGVDVAAVRRDPARSTGIFMKWRVEGGTSREYFRRGSAAGALSVDDVELGALDDVGWVHLTGITLALSGSSANAALRLARLATERSIPVSFDLNYRPVLWPDSAAAATAARRLLPYADWVLCGAEEGAILFGEDDPVEIGRAVQREGAGGAVIRTGIDGAWLVEQEPQHVPIPALEETVLDEIGAGDAFAAGFVAGMIRGDDPGRSVRLAHTVAAHALRGTGDWETLPRVSELEAEIE